MWIGNLELRNMYNFTRGFTYYIRMNHIKDEFAKTYDDYFNWWIQHTIRIENKENNDLYEDLSSNGSRSYVQFIPLIESNPKKQIELFFIYMDRFYEDYMKGMDFEAIKQLYSR